MTNTKKLNLIAPLLPIWLATFLYWRNLENLRTTWDHAYPLAQAQLLLELNHWPLMGQVTTFFFSNPPGQAYMNLAPLIMLRSPWGVYWWMATLNILAVPLVYRIGHIIYGKQGAFIGAILYASSPWVVLYSRANWAQALAPVFTALILTLLLTTNRERDAKISFWCFSGGLLAFTIFSQSYLLALVIGSWQVAAILLLRFKHINWRGVLVGTTVFALFTTFFFINLAEDWPVQLARLGDFSTNKESSEFKLDALLLAINYVSGLNYQAGVFGSPSLLLIATNLSGTIICISLLVGIILAIINSRYSEEKHIMKVGLLLWWLIPIVFLSYNNRAIHDWHSILTIPAGHILAAGGFVILLKYRWIRPLVFIGIILMTLPLIMMTSLTSNFNASHPAFAELDQVTLGASLELGEEIRELVAIYDLHEIYAGLPSTTTIAWSLKALDTISWYIDPDLVIVPLDKYALYMRIGHGDSPSLLPLSNRVSTIEFSGNDFVSFDIFPKMDYETVVHLPENQLYWPSETGLTLLGFTLIDDGNTGQHINLVTYWLIEGLADDRHEYIFSPYIHINDKNGLTLVNAGAPGLPGYYYRLNDIYIQTVSFTVPDTIIAGEYELNIGLYDGLKGKGTTFIPPDRVPQPFFSTVMTFDENKSITFSFVTRE